MNKRDFLKKIRKHLKEHRFKLVLHKTEYIDNSGFRCSGVFRYHVHELHVAQGHPRWFETTVHEYCHFLQYLENGKIWTEGVTNSRKWWKRMQ